MGSILSRKLNVGFKSSRDSFPHVSQPVNTISPNAEPLANRFPRFELKESVEMNGPRSKRTCRLRVLMSAYACEPERGSEPGVGWNWVQQIGRFEEVWVITRANNRQAIEDAPATQLLPNVHFIYFDLPRWSCFWKRGVRGIHAYYYLWQLGAYFVARKLHRKVGFDLVHHVTFVNYWMPSFLALLPVCGVGDGGNRFLNQCRMNGDSTRKKIRCATFRHAEKPKGSRRVPTV
jgi:hypothetical protein